MIIMILEIFWMHSKRDLSHYLKCMNAIKIKAQGLLNFSNLISICYINVYFKCLPEVVIFHIYLLAIVLSFVNCLCSLFTHILEF